MFLWKACHYFLDLQIIIKLRNGQRNFWKKQGGFKVFYSYIFLIFTVSRDDLELIHKGVQTDKQSNLSFTDVSEAIKTQEKFTQTDDDGSFQFEILVKSLACNAVKESLFDLLAEEINMMWYLWCEIVNSSQCDHIL